MKLRRRKSEKWKWRSKAGYTYSSDNTSQRFELQIFVLKYSTGHQARLAAGTLHELGSWRRTVRVKNHGSSKFFIFGRSNENANSEKIIREKEKKKRKSEKEIFFFVKPIKS